MAGNRNSGRPKASNKLKLLKSGKPRRTRHNPRKFPYRPANWPLDAQRAWERLATAAKALELQGLDSASKPGIKLIVALDVLTEQAFLRLRDHPDDETAHRILKDFTPLQIRLLAAYGLSPGARARVTEDARDSAVDPIQQLLSQAPGAG